MRFLADESCDFTIVRELRKAGHEVIPVSERGAGLDDATVLHRSVSLNAVLLTEDHDFGRLVFAARASSRGVILIRMPPKLRMMAAAMVVEVAAHRGDALRTSFVVIEPGRTRISRPND